RTQYRRATARGYDETVGLAVDHPDDSIARCPIGRNGRRRAPSPEGGGRLRRRTYAEAAGGGVERIGLQGLAVRRQIQRVIPERCGRINARADVEVLRGICIPR